MFAAVPGKSGTTWLINTLHHIRSRGSPPPFRDIYEEARWPELWYYPGQSLEDRIRLLKETASRYPFAIYKTHSSGIQLAVRGDAKYIICVRNAVDVVASLFPFLRNHDVGFAKMWGGFPPQAGEPEAPTDMALFEHQVLKDMGMASPLSTFFSFNPLSTFGPFEISPMCSFCISATE